MQADALWWFPSELSSKSEQLQFRVHKLFIYRQHSLLFVNFAGVYVYVLVMYFIFPRIKLLIRLQLKSPVLFSFK